MKIFEFRLNFNIDSFCYHHLIFKLFWISKLIFIFFVSAKILLFYTLFYLALAGFFTIMLVVFYQTLDDRMPKWQLTSSLIGDNPGMWYKFS